MTPAAIKALIDGNEENFIAAITPGGIEAQEKRGQLDQARKQTLPRDGTIESTMSFRDVMKPNFEHLGFEFSEVVDDCFVNVKFPEGWKKEPTEHYMWSNLVDNKGRIRANIFYKAAFYDRSAHITLVNRFSISRYVTTEKPKVYAVEINDCGKPIERIGEWESMDSKAEDMLHAKAREKLLTMFPIYENPMAYWD